MYDPTRIRYPMKRIGERGSGRWQRLSWDQALAPGFFEKSDFEAAGDGLFVRSVAAD